MTDNRALAKASLMAAGVGLVVTGLWFTNFARTVMLQPKPDCKEWNTKAFFEIATPTDVFRCLENGANIDARTQRGWTPLDLAASFSHPPAVVKALLHAGANIDARTRGGWTPLHRAARWNDSPVAVQVLLDAGANPAAKTSYGDIPWDFDYR